MKTQTIINVIGCLVVGTIVMCSAPEAATTIDIDEYSDNPDITFGPPVIEETEESIRLKEEEIERLEYENRLIEFHQQEV